MNALNMVKNKFRLNITVILVLFALSVIVRLDNLKEPLGIHHEFLTGHVLTTLSIYEKNGIASHYFSPVLRFNNAADRKMISTMAFKDKNGYNYYVSYPPFCFIAPYLAFKLTFSKVSVTGIRIFGLVNHFFCALLVFFLILRLFNKKIKTDFFVPSVIGFTLYLFASGNLWFHANVYFADMLVHLFILSSLYIFLTILENPESRKKAKLLLLFIATFLGVYTEWIALFVATFMGLFLLIKLFRSRVYLKYIVILFLAAIMPISLTIWQYSSIAGFTLLKEQSINKYNTRSGYNKELAEGGLTIDKPACRDTVFKHYLTNYEHLLEYGKYCLFIFLALLVSKWLDKRTKIPPSHIITFLILLCSILTHHLLFFNFTVVHDFSTLKSSIFLVLFISYTLGLLLNHTENFKVRNMINCASAIFTIWIVHLSLQKYYSVNRPDAFSYAELTVAESIKKYSKPEEVIFTDLYATPVLYYYAQRNVIQVRVLPECIWYLNEYKHDKGFYIRVKKSEWGLKLEGIRLTNKGDSTRVF